MIVAFAAVIGLLFGISAAFWAHFRRHSKT
jgi:uncharacterized protein involved in exopolysaccharide biosynthesis